MYIGEMFFMLYVGYYTESECIIHNSVAFIQQKAFLFFNLLLTVIGNFV